MNDTKTSAREGSLIDDLRQNEAAPENWEFVGSGGEHSARGDERFRNDCGLWLVIEGSKVVTWVGNFHVAVRGTVTEIGQFDTEEAAREAAQEWMEENPNPWAENRSSHPESDRPEDSE